MKTVLLTLCILTTLNIFAEESYVGLDVRSYIERVTSPAPGAIALTNSEISKNIAEKVPNKNTPIKVFCEVGARASRSKRILERMGYKNVENINSWREWNKLQQEKKK